MIELELVVGYILRHIEQMLPDENKRIVFGISTPEGYVKKNLVIETGTTPRYIDLDWLDVVVKDVRNIIGDWLRDNSGKDVFLNLAFDSITVKYVASSYMDRVIVSLTYFEKV